MSWVLGFPLHLCHKNVSWFAHGFKDKVDFSNMEIHVLSIMENFSGIISLKISFLAFYFLENLLFGVILKFLHQFLSLLKYSLIWISLHLFLYFLGAILAFLFCACPSLLLDFNIAFHEFTFKNFILMAPLRSTNFLISYIHCLPFPL